jgi:two-component sensor histidine kinase
MRLPAFLSVLVLLPILILAPSSPAATAQLQLVGGHLELGPLPEELSLVTGDWYFASENVTQIMDEDLAKLPLRNPFQSNFQFLNLVPGPAQGAYILRIRAAQKAMAHARFGGATGNVQIKLQQGGESLLLFQTPGYDQPHSPGYDQKAPLLLPLPLVSGDQFLIVNYRQKPFEKNGESLINAGLIGPMKLGSKEAIDRKESFGELFLKIPLGIFACLSLYSLLIYTSRRGEDKESLVLFFLNASMFLKEFFSQGINTSFVEPGRLITTLSAMGYGFPELGTAVSIFYLQMKYPSRFLRGLFYFTMGYTALIFLNGFVLVNVSFLPNTSVISGIGVLLNALVFFLIFIPYALYSSIRTRDYEVIAFTIGILALGGGTILDFVNLAQGLGWPWMSMPGGIVLSLILAKNNSLMFARAYDQSKRLNIELEARNQEVKMLNASLEIKVQERTAEINALLQHIPQGVLSIGAHGLVEPNFSAHLPDILGHKQITQRSFKDLFLDHCDLSSDLRDQCWQTIQASIHESALNFDMNADKFPQEAWYVYQEQRKLVKLTWNAELDAQDNVRRMLVTMLDISLEHEARQELEEKNKDLTIIRELIDAGVKKCMQFFATARQLLEENQRFLVSGELNIDSIKILFVNMHTVKGAARTLQFKELSASLHDCEAAYAAIIKHGAPIVAAKLRLDLHQLSHVFERYVQVNTSVLGRSEDYSKIPIDREFLEHHYQLLNILDQKVGLASEIKDVIHRNKDKLTHWIFMSLSTVMNDVLQQSEKIARDLQKEVPRIESNVADVLINHRQEMTLKNSFIHILRNALDHGIESAAERQAKGKDPRGMIHINAYEDASCITIEVWDDGRGLPLGLLREKAESSGLLKPGAGLNEVAETIFLQGMSTAKSLSQVSGRGVGMDAVKRFFEAENGSIQVLLGEPKDATNRYYGFKFRITLPRENADIFEDGSKGTLAS